MSQSKDALGSQPDEVECANCNKTVLGRDYLFEAQHCVFCKGEEQDTDPKTVAVEALLHAADTVERYVENNKAHYEGTNHEAHTVGDRETYRRAFNSADKYVCDSPVSGEDFERATDIFSEPLTLALKHDISGKDAAEFYRNQAKALLK